MDEGFAKEKLEARLQADKTKHVPGDLPTDIKAMIRFELSIEFVCGGCGGACRDISAQRCFAGSRPRGR